MSTANKRNRTQGEGKVMKETNPLRLRERSTVISWSPSIGLVLHERSGITGPCTLSLSLPFSLTHTLHTKCTRCGEERRGGKERPGNLKPF